MENLAVMPQYGARKQACLLISEHVLRAGQPALMVQVMTEVWLSDGRISSDLGSDLYGVKQQTDIHRSLFIAIKTHLRRT